MKIRFQKLAIQAALALAIGSFSGVVAAANPIKIGVIGPFTGGSSSMGVSMRDGVKLAVEEINKSGGVLGRQIQIVERDDEARNERGVQIAQEMVNKEKVAAAVGYINTGVALASQRFFQEAKIPVMNNVATGSAITHQFDDQPENYIFRNSAHDSIQAPMIVEEAITRRGFKKVAILADSTNYGQLGREDLEKALSLKGIKPVAVEKFNIKDVDMTKKRRCSRQEREWEQLPPLRNGGTPGASWAERTRLGTLDRFYGCYGMKQNPYDRRHTGHLPFVCAPRLKVWADGSRARKKNALGRLRCTTGGV